MNKNVIDLRKERKRRGTPPPAGGGGEEQVALDAEEGSLPPGEGEARQQGGALAEQEAIERITATNEESEPEPIREERETQAAVHGLLVWEALEFTPHKKDQRAWIQTTALVAIPLALLTALTKNVLGVIVILLAAVTFLLSAFRKPRRLTYELKENGIIAGNSFMSFTQIESFWIFDDEENRVLSLKRKGLLVPYLKIPLGDTDADEVRAILKNYVTEEEQQPSAFDALLRRIGY